MRENSSRQQAREFRTRHRKGQLYTVHERESRHTRLCLERMSTENKTGVQTRDMAQQVDNEANLEQLQRAADPAMNPTVELHRTKEEAIKEFVWQHGTITLDWYVPDLCNTRVGDLIKKRLQLKTMEGRILFRSSALSEFFKTSNFELNLKTGGVFTYSTLQRT